MNTTEEPAAPATEPVPLEGAPDPGQPAPDAPPAEPLEGAPDSDDAETRGEDDVETVTPPEGVVSDAHDHPLDDDEDARFLPRGDARRKLAEQRRGRPFDQEQEPEAGEQADEGGEQQADDES